MTLALSAVSIRCVLIIDTVNKFSYLTGGRELVFQTGPNHPWLIKIYANSANYPYANIVGQEFFQTGLIPAETDFRIFRDYGNIPGRFTNHLNFDFKNHDSKGQ